MGMSYLCLEFSHSTIPDIVLLSSTDKCRTADRINLIGILVVRKSQAGYYTHLYKLTKEKAQTYDL